MMLDNIPKIGEEQIKEQFNILNQNIAQGQVNDWLNDELENLHEKNPVLFHYIVERAKKFAIGAIMVGDPNSASISLALEYILLLNILNAGIGNSIGLGKFTDMMKGLLKNDDLKGLDNFGKEKD